MPGGRDLIFGRRSFSDFMKSDCTVYYLYPGGGRWARAQDAVQCRNSEMLIDPSGFIFRCHHDVYNGLNPIGHILDADLKMERKLRAANFSGNVIPAISR